MKNVRIVSTGPNSAYPVQVIDADTCEEIQNVRSIDLRIRPDEIVTATIEVLQPAIDVVARAKIVEPIDPYEIARQVCRSANAFVQSENVRRGNNSCPFDPADADAFKAVLAKLAPRAADCAAIAT